ncbi:hypothetical protein [Desulfotignum phosphitoxidans]|jgi:hypothetical protein|uniref:Uncharacterized protein n=1 Tax=Desulfotignum phosphitoxidans DSM 13687 TaxID=1286635 RepID=S0FWJ3_9BACT|nr:hypothetical protein [Desulfotignum phosphitoxidans]EMS79438.1 hypothetical protein Dpo_5c03650 [Desulfotignum phosphitoxidans DSM 13687]
MEAIEFKTKIKNGLIRIPDKFRQKNGDTVKVIILSEQKVRQTDIIDKLLLTPVKSKQFSPLLREEIYDRVSPSEILRI